MSENDNSGELKIWRGEVGAIYDSDHGQLTINLKNIPIPNTVSFRTDAVPSTYKETVSSRKRENKKEENILDISALSAGVVQDLENVLTAQYTPSLVEKEQTVSLSPKQEISILAPPPDLLLSSEQTIMLDISETGEGTILRTKNWVYPDGSVSNEGLSSKARITANFLNFQDPDNGHRHAWMVNKEKAEVIHLCKQGKFSVRDIHTKLATGYTEFFYYEDSVKPTNFFRLSDGRLILGKSMEMLVPGKSVSASPKEDDSSSSEAAAKKFMATPTVFGG